MQARPSSRGGMAVYGCSYEARLMPMPAKFNRIADFQRSLQHAFTVYDGEIARGLVKAAKGRYVEEIKYQIRNTAGQVPGVKHNPVDLTQMLRSFVIQTTRERHRSSS